jgi:hypothetical protein
MPGDTNKVGLYIKEETTWGEVPAGALTLDQLRYTGSSLEHRKTSEGSEVIRDDRMIDSVAELAADAGGTIDVELAAGALTSLFEGLTNLTGMLVVLAGFTTAGNNGVFAITAHTDDSTITVDNASGATETGSGTETISGNMIRNDVKPKKSYMILEDFTDTAQQIWLAGMRVGQMTFSLDAQQRITGQVGFEGQQGRINPTVGPLTLNAAVPTDPMTASANVTDILLDGAVLPGGAYARSMELTLNGNPRTVPVIGDKFPQDIGLGRFEFTGTLNVLFDDPTLYQKMLDHEYFSLAVKLLDGQGNAMSISFPRAVFTGGAPTAPGSDQDVLMPLTFQAVQDTTLGFGIQIDDIVVP